MLMLFNHVGAPTYVSEVPTGAMRRKDEKSSSEFEFGRTEIVSIRENSDWFLGYLNTGLD